MGKVAPARPQCEREIVQKFWCVTRLVEPVREARQVSRKADVRFCGECIDAMSSAILFIMAVGMTVGVAVGMAVDYAIAITICDNVVSIGQLPVTLLP